MFYYSANETNKNVFWSIYQFFWQSKIFLGKGLCRKKPKSTGFFYTEYLEKKVQRKEKFFFLKKNELICFIVFVLID